MTLTLLTAVDHRHEAQLVAALEVAPDIRVVRRCADTPELLSVAASGAADLALVSATFRGVDRDARRSLASHGVRTIGVCSADDEVAERVLRQLGVPDIVDPGASPDSIAQSLRSLGIGEGLASVGAGGAFSRATDPVDRPAPDLVGPSGAAASGLRPIGVGAGLDPTPQSIAPEESVGSGDDGPVGRVVAVWGPTGAPGRTTLAVSLAALAASEGKQVLLIDADTWGGSIGQVLGLVDEAPGIAAAARLSEQGMLDVPRLSRVSPEVAPGLRVLTGLPRPDRWHEVRAAAMADVLAVATRLAQVVIVDCGFAIEDDEELSYDTAAPRRNATTLASLAAADELVVVGSADPVGLQRLVRAVQDVVEHADVTPRVVVNKTRRSACGPDPERTITELLGRFAGLDVVHCLPWAPDETDRALWEGRSLSEVAGDGQLVTAIRAFAGGWLLTQESAVRRGRRRRR